MRYRDNHPTSAQFRHVTRSLQPGEALPNLPSLSEQLRACHGAMQLPLPSQDEDEDELLWADAPDDSDDSDDDL